MSRYGFESPFERLTRDVEEQLAQFRALTQPPWTRMVDELSRAHLATLPHFDSIRQLEDQFRHLDLLTRPEIPDIPSSLAAAGLAYSPSVPVMMDALRELSVASIPDIARLADEIVGTTRLSVDLTLPILRSVHDAITEIAASPSQFKLKFESSFADQLFRALRKVEDAEDEELPLHLGRLVEIFIQTCRSLLPDQTHAWGMFSTLLTLMIFLHSIISDRQTEERIVSRVENAEQRSVDAIDEAVRTMVAAVEQLRPPEQAAAQYVVVREVRLRIRPTSKARAVRLLYPNELASFLDSKGTWIKVRVFDYVRGSANTGWVLKKYLKRLEPPPHRAHRNVPAAPQP